MNWAAVSRTSALKQSPEEDNACHLIQGSRTFMRALV
jgi:hypothetical protein